MIQDSRGNEEKIATQKIAAGPSDLTTLPHSKN
jgi:hypothetical protein